MTERGRQLYKLMADGEAVPNAIVDDLIAENMVKKKDSKVNFYSCKNSLKTVNDRMRSCGRKKLLRYHRTHRTTSAQLETFSC